MIATVQDFAIPGILGAMITFVMTDLLGKMGVPGIVTLALVFLCMWRLGKAYEKRMAEATVIAQMRTRIALDEEFLS